MSSPTRPRPIEERLTAALHARAEQVAPEDLTPLLVPKQRRSQRPVLLVAGVAAAVAAAVVAVPLVGGDGGGREPRPAPAATRTPEPSPSVEQGRRRMVVDMDGDGTDDRVRVEDGYMFVALDDGTEGGAEVAPGSALLPPVTDAGTGNPLVVAVPPVGSDQPATTVTYRRAALVFDEAPSLAAGPGRTVWVDEIGALMAGSYDDEAPRQQRVAVNATAYRVNRNGRLVGYQAGTLCWDRAARPFPVECDQLPHQDADPSLMFPMVEDRYPVGTSHGSFDGEFDNIVLARTGDGYELRYTWDAVESRAPVGPGAPPELLGAAIASSLDAPAVVVAQESGDSTAMTVYAPTSKGFRALDVEGGRFLGNSFGDEPDFLAQRTWMAQASGLWTASQVSEDEPDRFRVTRWTVDDTVLRADDQGVACLDLDRGRRLPDTSCGLS